MATGKPRNAIEFTQPSWVSVRPNFWLSSVRMPARIANVIAVTISAMQLAKNSREGFSLLICLGSFSRGEWEKARRLKVRNVALSKRKIAPARPPAPRATACPRSTRPPIGANVQP